MTDAIGGTAWSAALQGASRPQHGGFRQAITGAAASALGMNQQDLVAGLRQGQSLADLAQQQGVSRDQLVSAVAGAIQSTGGASATGAAQDANAIAQRVVDRKGGGHHHHGHVRAAGSGSGSDPDGDGDTDGASGADNDGASASSPFSVLSGLLGMGQSKLTSAGSESALGQPGSTVDTTA